MLQCNIWVENLKTANKVQNGSVFIYDGNIKLIRDNSIGITEGSSKIQPNNIYLIYSVNKWYSISTEITTSTTSNGELTVLFASCGSKVAIDNDSLLLTTIDYVPPIPNYGSSIHTFDFKEVVEVEIKEYETTPFVSNSEIGQIGGLISNTSILHTDGEVAYQNININNSEKGGTIYINYEDEYNFEGDGKLSKFIDYLQEQLNNKSINQIKYQVSYSDDSGIIQIKHQNSTSKTSFYIRESYNFNKSTQRNEIVYEQVYRKVKTYFDFSKLTSVGPILGFVSNDTQFCNDNYSVSSTISFTNNFRRMNMLRYISTYGMEYTGYSY